MSQENVELVRRGFERFNDGDVDGFLQLCAPNVEVRDASELPGARVSRGHDAVRAWYAQLLDAFDDLRFEPEEFIDVGDRVLVAHHATAHERRSRAEVEMPLFSAYVLREGKVVSLITYSTRA